MDNDIVFFIFTYKMQNTNILAFWHLIQLNKLFLQLAESFQFDLKKYKEVANQ